MSVVTKCNLIKVCRSKSTYIKLVVAVMIYIFMVTEVGFIGHVPSTSMQPALRVGDIVLVNRLYFNPKRYDVVVFYSNELDMVLVKRLIGLPGDNVHIEGSNILINGELAHNYMSSYSVLKKDFTVPQDCYLFLGDNAADSDDARYWTNPYIEKKDIIGVVELSIFPLHTV